MMSYDGKGQQYICTAKAFKAEDGKTYTFLAILPGDKVNLQLNLINSPFPVSRAFFTVILTSGLFFLMLFLLNIYLYSKWTTGKISNPLARITAALSDMGKGRLNTRMDFEAENEFLQIRDTFNYMADKLEMAEADKKRLEESRKRMFVDISHDLKTPVTTISGYCKALSEGIVKDEEQKQRYLRTIYDKSIRVANLIDDLFELAKLEGREPELNREAVDIVELLRSMAAEHYEQMEEKGLLLDFRVPDCQVTCNIDRKEIVRVLSNILGNAIRYRSHIRPFRKGGRSAEQRRRERSGSGYCKKDT